MEPNWNVQVKDSLNVLASILKLDAIHCIKCMSKLMACVVKNYKPTLEKLCMYLSLWELQEQLGHISFREDDSYSNQGCSIYLCAC